LLAFLSLSARHAPACGLDWNLPHDHFDGMDKFGYVSYWKTIGELDLGEGLVLPIHIHFSSNQETSSPYLGSGWTLPLLESHIVFREENLVEVHEPNGRTRLFWRDPNDFSLFHGQGGWLAQSLGPTFIAWADCGWKLVFTNGQLVGITSPKDRKLEFVYRNGTVTEIREGGQKKLSVDQESDGSGQKALSFNGKRIGIELGERPRVQIIAGQNVVAGVDQSLRRLAEAEGVAEEFHFDINDRVQPTLKMRQKNQRQLNIKEPDGAIRQIAWDPLSRRILRDNEWQYDITEPPSPWENAAILRNLPDGKREYWYEDVRRTRAVSLKLDGSGRARWNYEDGTLKGLVREERTLHGGVLSIFRPDYDKRGNAIGGASYSIKIGNADPLVELTRVIEDLQRYAVANHRLDATADGILLEARTGQRSDKIWIKRAEDGALRFVFENPK
jgi:hypothetical protein